MEALIAIIATFQVLLLMGLWNQARLLRKVTERILQCEAEINDIWKEHNKEGRQFHITKQQVECLKRTTQDILESYKILDQRTQKTIVFTPNRKKP